MLGQTYRDIVVGSIAWMDYNKSADLLGLGLTIALVLGFAALAVRQLHRHLPAEWRRPLLAPWTLSPAIAIASGVLTTLFIQDQLGMPLPLTAVFVFSLLASALVAAGSSDTRWTQRFWPAFFTAAHALFAVVATLCLFEWIVPGATDASFALPLGICALLALIGYFWVKPSARLSRALAANRWWQLPIPLLLLRLTHLSQVKGEDLLVLAPQPLGNAIVFGFVASLCALQWRGLRASKSPESRWPTLLALGAYLAYVTPLASPLLMDDFHFGELALPWHQIIEKGSRPYSEYVPIQGWLGFLSGAFNAFLYDGKIATLLPAKAFAEALVGGVSAVLAGRILGARLVWFLLPALHLFPEAGDRLLLVFPFTVLLFDPAWEKRRGLRLVAWPFLAAVHCLYNAPAGVAWTVATAPIAWVDRKSATPRQWACGAGALALFTAVFFPWLTGWFRFLLNNGSSNEVAYGLGFLQMNSNLSPSVDNPTNRIYLECLRSGGWVVAMGLGALFAFAQRPGARIAHRDGVLFGAVLVLIPVLLVPYTLGRMDPFVLSRTGVASLVCLGILGTFTCLWALKRWPSAPVWSAALGLCLGYTQAFFPSDVTEWVQRPALRMQMPEELVKIDGAKFGMPKTGTLYTPSDRWQEIVNFYTTVQNYKGKEGTYLDLTNRSLLYALVDEKCPVPLASDYHAFNQALQELNLQALRANPPMLVWLGPSMRHDGGPASLRNYRVYRWLLESGLYAPRHDGAINVLVHRSKLPAGKTALVDEAALLETVFRPSHLGLIGTSWGRSWGKMAGRFTKVMEAPHPPSLVAKDQKSRILASVEDDKLNPEKERPDFLLLEIGSESPYLKGGKGVVRWRRSGSADPTGSLEFNWKPGMALIPIGASPAWLLADTVADLEIELDSEPVAQLRRLTALRLTR